MDTILALLIVLSPLFVLVSVIFLILVSIPIMLIDLELEYRRIKKG